MTSTAIKMDEAIKDFRKELAPSRIDEVIDQDLLKMVVRGFFHKVGVAVGLYILDPDAKKWNDFKVVIKHKIESKE